MAKENGISEGAIREAMAAVMATSGGRPRAQAREALKGLLDAPTAKPAVGGCCHD